MLPTKQYFFIFLLSFPTILFAQPKADFSAIPVSGCAPVVVQFTNNSTGSNSWQWDFGNGNTSWLKNPAAIYGVSGIYAVTLIAKDTLTGKSDTIKKNSFLSVYAPPVAKFSAGNIIGCTSLSVNFNDLSIEGSGKIINWNWDFGDGNKSTDKNPVHIYNTPGDFTVYLIVKDTNGCQNIFFIEKYIHVENIHAGFSFPSKICVNTPTVDFNNSSSGNGLTFAWDFGDGATSNQQNPSHSFPSVIKSYSVKLLVTNAIGCKDSSIQNINTVSLKSDFNYSINCADDTFLNTYTISLFDLSNPTPDGWQWDFGDGSSSTSQNPSHQYNFNQSYTIRLISNIGVGCVDTILKTYIPPQANFVTDTSYSCESPLVVKFTNQSSGTDSLSFLWNFDDGTLSTDTNIIHTFNSFIKIDTFFTKLITANKFGCTDTIYDSIIISKPLATIAVNDTQGCVPLTIFFNDISTSDDPIVSWSWNFGDGNTSILQNSSHSYPNWGNYFASLKVTTQKGCVSSTGGKIKAGLKPDFIDFTLIPGDTICHHSVDSVAGIVGFNDTSIKVNSWCWEFHWGRYRNWYSDYLDITCRDSGYLDLNNSLATVLAVKHAYDEFGDVCDTIYFANDTFGVMLPQNCFGPDTIGFMAGLNGCYKTIFKPIYLKPPSAIPGYLYPKNQFIQSTCALASCSSPATFGFFNGSVLWNKFNFYNITHVQSGKIWILDSLKTPLDFRYSYADYEDDTFLCGITLKQNITPQQVTFLTFNKAGNYIIKISVSDTIGGCTDVKGNYLTIDSVHNGFTITPKVNCIDSNKFFFKDTTKSFFGYVSGWYWDFGDGTIVSSLDSIYSINEVKKDTIYSINPLSGDTIWFRYGSKYNKNDTIKPPDSTFYTYGLYGSPVHIYKDTGKYVVRSLVGVRVPFSIEEPHETDTYHWCFYESYDTIKINGIHNSFKTDDTLACFNQPVIFSNLSSSTSSILSTQWDFGDGNSSGLKNPQHIYPNAGTYTVSLKVKDNNGCESSLTKNNYIKVFRPIAAFSVRDTLCTGSTISFSNSSSGENIICIWNYGDGSKLDTTPNPSHIYNVGAYTIKLRIIDKNNCEDTTSKKISVVNNPVAAFSSDTTKADCFPLIVNFTSQSAGSNITQWLWDFGDGASSNSMDPQHIYTTNGYFDVHLIITTSYGCTDDTLISPYISIEAPEGTFTVVTDTVCYPDSILFITNSQHAGYYIWDFGDGNIEAFNSSQIIDTIGHLYHFSGSFIPTLLLYNASQQCPYIVASTLKVTVEKVGADFFPNKSVLCELDSVIFIDSTYSLFSVEHHWNFGDGDSITTSLNEVKHFFNSSGVYTVSLFVKDTYGCQSYVTRQIIVNEEMKLEMNSSDTLGCVPFTINFTAGSQLSFLPDSVWHWNFGDGTFGQGDTINHTFSSGGIFPVKLEVKYAQGKCNVDTSMTIEAVSLPEINFEPYILNKSCYTQSKFEFKNNTTNAVRYLWNFGNDSISTQSNPRFGYPADSVYYSVKLVAYNNLGCSDSAIILVLAYDNTEKFRLPNVFTPYPSSPGYNDFFVIPGLGENSSIKIFNRWGEKIYESENYNNDWDGKDYRTGKELKSDVYFFLLGLCKETHIRGFVHILREQ